MLDTNILIWILAGEDRKISRRAHKVISSPHAFLCVSIVSIWEVVLKWQTGRLWSDVTTDSVVALIESQSAWRILPLELAHLRTLGEIAQFRDHTDPFDRMLIAQARAEGLRIVTADEQFSRYDVEVVW